MIKDIGKIVGFVALVLSIKIGGEMIDNYQRFGRILPVKSNILSTERDGNFKIKKVGLYWNSNDTVDEIVENHTSNDGKISFNVSYIPQTSEFYEIPRYKSSEQGEQ